eukprot:6484865-Amphidinium_carterae.1
MDRECPCCAQCFVGCLDQGGDQEENAHEHGGNGQGDLHDNTYRSALVAEGEWEKVPDGEVSQHRIIEPLHDTPLWGLVTRQIFQNEKESHSEGCQAALREEHEKLLKRGVWDTSTVCELRNLYKDRSQEDLLGQVFPIMGEKFAEEGVQRRQYKARIVFAGDRVKTKSGCDPVDLYTEMSNSPTTLAAARLVHALGQG